MRPYIRNIRVVVLILFLLIRVENLVAQKWAHISINGNPNGFFFMPKKDTQMPNVSNYLGVSVLPELEASFDVSNNTRVFASLLWTDISKLTSTTSTNSSAPVTSINASNSNVAILAGLNFSLGDPDDDRRDKVTAPIINSFSIGAGYGNLYTSKDTNGKDIFQSGWLIVLGFKVRVLSFNIGK